METVPRTYKTMPLRALLSLLQAFCLLLKDTVLKDVTVNVKNDKVQMEERQLRRKFTTEEPQR